MTIATPPRPSASPQPRRPGGHAPTAVQASAIDPIKLLKRHKLTLILTCFVGVGVGIAAHFAWLFIWPFWTARVVYQCTPPQEELGETTGVVSGSEDELARFMATQVAIMTSERVLINAAEDPRLLDEAKDWSRQFVKNGRYSPADAAIELGESVRARIITGTELIEMSMIWKDKVNVAGVVGVINDAYWADLNRQRRLDRQKEQDAVARAIQNLEGQIKKLSTERDTALREAGIDSLDDRVGSVQQAIALANEQRSSILVAVEGVRDELLALEAELRGPSPMPTFPDTMRQMVEQHQLVLQQKNNIQMLESQLSGYRHRGIMPENRTYKMVEAQLDGVKQELANLRQSLLLEFFQSRIDGLRQFLRQSAAQIDDLDKRILSGKATMNDLLRLQAKVTDIQNEIDLFAVTKNDYQKTLTTLEQLDELTTASRVMIVEGVRVPTQVTFPKIYIMIPLGVIVTFGLVSGFILLSEMLDQRVKGPADISLISRTRVLGIVPHASEDPSNPKSVESVFADNERGVMAESYRQLRASIMKTMRRNDYRSLLVIAGMPGSGASSVVSNLAQACAAADQRVLVVDANFRRPQQHKTAGVSEAPGLAEVLSGSHSLGGAIQRSADGRFDILTAGTSESRLFEHLATPRMHAVLNEASEDYDLILVDVAPAVVAGDAFELANRVDATCLVTRAYSEKRGMVARLRNELEESKGEFIGVIVNAVRSSAGGYFKRNLRETHQYQNGD